VRPDASTAVNAMTVVFCYVTSYALVDSNVQTALRSPSNHGTGLSTGVHTQRAGCGQAYPNMSQKIKNP
jgi:hypothetical protein